MNIELEKNESTLLVKAEGRLDLDSANEYGPKVMEALIEGEVKEVVLDFSKITFLSSMGLRAILEIYKKVQEKQGSFKIKNVSDDIKKSFNLVGFSKFIVLE